MVSAGLALRRGEGGAARWLARATLTNFIVALAMCSLGWAYIAALLAASGPLTSPGSQFETVQEAVP